MTAKEILDEIKPLGSEGYKRVLSKHGVKEPFFGVKIGDMQKIVKRIKRDLPHEIATPDPAPGRGGSGAAAQQGGGSLAHGVNRLALDLYDTGVYDARYLAGLIADDMRMTRKDLQHWVAKADCAALCGSTVPWVASGSPHGRELAQEWIESKKPLIAVAGWATLSSLVSIKDDAELDLPALKRLLQRVQKTIHASPDPVRYQMNSFVIAVGCYVASLTDTAIQIAEKIGLVTVDMGDTACQVPFAPDYIAKVQKRGTIGKKRKTAKC